MITIPKREEPQTTELYYKGDHIATVDYIQFLKIRVQIKQQKLTGYTITHYGEVYHIYPNGKIDTPNGLFDTETLLLYELL